MLRTLLLSPQKNNSHSVPPSRKLGISSIPKPTNEPIKGYLKGSKERNELESTLKKMRATSNLDIPIIIGGKEVRTQNKGKVTVPHDHKHVLATYNKAGPEEVKAAIEASLKAKEQWLALSSDNRLSIFLKIAELLAGPSRQIINASTVLNQSKNFFQAEIDSSCEFIDFLRFNAYFAQEIYSHQPASSAGVFNRFRYRPLEGFVYAISPFNFTAIAGNLSCAPAMMGNTVVWKPSDHAIFSGYQLMQLYKEAGLPDGVINFVPGDAQMITDIALSRREFAGLHYTGSTEVFRHLWKKVGDSVSNYREYPRIVGETGGKDFIFAHSSANEDGLVTALIRGAFEFAGQKCSACSRAYIPKGLWNRIKDKLAANMKQVKMGSPEQVDVLVNAVIHRQSFEKCKSYIEYTKQQPDAQIFSGGKYDDSVGWFIEPTIVVTSNPHYKLLQEEIFGPILTIMVYDDDKYVDTLKICNATSPYALTGSIFAQDRYAIEVADKELFFATGNFYINDKCTGAVVGQQPFGGARASGTNDKSGSHYNLLRWLSVQTIKETFVPASQVSYPYMEDK